MAANTRRPRRASALPDVTPIRRNRLAALALTAARYMDTAAPRTPLSERDTIRARTATDLTVQQQRQAGDHKRPRHGAAAPARTTPR
jgi:hypothetical protein